MPRELLRLLGVLLGALGAACWIVSGGPGVQLLVDAARDLWAAALFQLG